MVCVFCFPACRQAGFFAKKKKAPGRDVKSAVNMAAKHGFPSFAPDRFFFFLDKKETKNQGKIIAQRRAAPAPTYFAEASPPRRVPA